MYKYLMFQLCPLLFLVLIATPPTLAESTQFDSTADDSVLVSLPAVITPSERQLLLQEIQVTPAGETEKSILRLIPLQTGDPINPTVLIETRELLEASNLFEEIELYTARGDYPGAVILHVEAKLARGFRMETGLGREMMQGWYLNMLGARYTSPFRRGGFIRFGMQDADRHNGVYIDGEYPRLLGKNYDLLMELDHETENWPITERDMVWEQTISRSRIHFGITRWSPEHALVTLWLGYSWAKPEATMSAEDETLELEPEPVGRLVPVFDGKRHYIDLRLDLVWDRQDANSAWRRGWWTGLQLKASSIVDGNVFWGIKTDTRVALPIGNISALALRLRSAYASINTPYHLRPVSGGTGNMRGFETGSLSGPMGARGLVQGSVEWREPVLGRQKSKPNVITTLFLDVGEHWTSNQIQNGISANVGYGMLIRIPWIQTLNAEVSFPITDNLTDDSVILNISFGRSF